MLEFAESGSQKFNFPCYKSIVQRPAQKQRPWNCRYTIVPIWKRFKLFRTNITVNQLSLHGAVAEMCDDKTKQLVVGWTIEFLIRAKRDQDRSAFGL